DRQRRGISKVKLFEYELSAFKNDSHTIRINEIIYPDTVRYSTVYAAYSADSKNIILDAETLDRHTRKLFNYDIKKKNITQIYSESDFAWYERHGNSTKYLNDSVIIFESEVSGYNNIYSIKPDGGEFKKIAGGDFTITESVIDRLNNKLYFIANKDNPAEWNIYETDFASGSLTKITQLVGSYEELSISQDTENLFFIYSSITKPNELYHLNKISNTEKQITNTISPQFSSFKWIVPEIINFTNDEDGQLIYAFLYKPKDYTQKKKYPLICFAHGEGYLQEVTRGFSPYQDNFMVNTFLTSKGYLVLDVDFRGSKGYGKDFRNKTYQNLGYWEVSDFISGINHLDNLGMIDRNRVGIYGGSYGGFISLMAAFRNPEYFKSAAALRAVSDWKNYFRGNKWFILARLGDLNEENKNYYDISSPITYADNLQIPLLITHGMLDDNVFFQQAVHLTQKLIDSKKDFEVMFYPKEYHSFRLQTSWLDLYKRIFNFFEKHLKN
ncbi:MAG: prolyl oligopeptidase family serine peptidase, partial [Ignavibacteria bacterium]